MKELQLRQLRFTHYLCVVIIFFNTALSKSAFSTYYIGKLVFCLSVFYVFFVPWALNSMSYLQNAAYNNCFCKCHLATCNFAQTWWKLSICKNNVIKIWFWHIWLVKKKRSVIPELQKRVTHYEFTNRVTNSKIVFF